MKRSELWRRVALVLVMVFVLTRVVCAQVPSMESMKDVEDLDVEDLREIMAQAWLIPEDKNEELVELYTRIIERLQEFPETGRVIKYAYVGRGVRREGLGDIKGAIRDFTKAIEVDPLYSGAYVARAQARMKLGDAKGARRDERAAAEAEKKGDHELRDINERLAQGPDDPHVLYDRAFHKASKGDYEGAIRDYKRALAASEPDNKEFLMKRLVVAQEQIGDYQAAIATASRAIDLFPDRDHWYKKRAELRASAGDLSGARADLQEFSRRVRRKKLARIQELTESLNQNPNDARLLLARADHWKYLGENDKALSDVHKALSVASDPNRKQWARRLEASIRVTKEGHQHCEYVQRKRMWEHEITRLYREQQNRDEARAKTP